MPRLFVIKLNPSSPIVLVDTPEVWLGLPVNPFLLYGILCVVINHGVFAPRVTVPVEFRQRQCRIVFITVVLLVIHDSYKPVPTVLNSHRGAFRRTLPLVLGVPSYFTTRQKTRYVFSRPQAVSGQVQFVRKRDVRLRLPGTVRGESLEVYDQHRGEMVEHHSLRRFASRLALGAVVLVRTTEPLLLGEILEALVQRLGSLLRLYSHPRPGSPSPAPARPTRATASAPSSTWCGAKRMRLERRFGGGVREATAAGYARRGLVGGRRRGGEGYVKGYGGEGAVGGGLVQARLAFDAVFEHPEEHLADQAPGWTLKGLKHSACSHRWGFIFGGLQWLSLPVLANGYNGRALLFPRMLRLVHPVQITVELIEKGLGELLAIVLPGSLEFGSHILDQELQILRADVLAIDLEIA
mmetsp:Transcript_39937/g.77659  ORF Transcript_39937/g.77659 Transcript_39937/m.77659 type:complete len:410 (+) Transcript_39937:248-1477(+)